MTFKGKNGELQGRQHWCHWGWATLLCRNPCELRKCLFSILFYFSRGREQHPWSSSCCPLPGHREAAGTRKAPKSPPVTSLCPRGAPNPPAVKLCPGLGSGQPGAGQNRGTGGARPRGARNFFCSMSAGGAAPSAGGERWVCFSPPRQRGADSSPQVREEQTPPGAGENDGNDGNDVCFLPRAEHLSVRLG